MIGCITTHEPPQPAQEVTSRAVRLDFPLWTFPKYDVVIAIDHSPAMQPYRARLAEQLPSFAQRLQRALPDVHVAVLAPDGSLATDPAVHGAFLVDNWRTEGVRAPNYDGAIADVILRMAALDVVTDTQPTPLADITELLAAHPTFARRDARLAVVVIAADDDHSAGDVATYLEQIDARHRVGWSAVSVASPCTAAPRLESVSEHYGQRAGDVRICEGDLAELAPSVARPTVLTGCVDAPLLDTDATLPGLQASCAAELEAEGTTQILSSCSDGGAPCWTIEEALGCGLETGPRFAVTRPLVDLPYGSRVRADCLVAQ